MILAAVAIVVVGGLAATLAIVALRPKDAAVANAGTVVIPQSLGGLAQSTDPTVKLVAAGLQSEAQTAAKGHGTVTSMGYGDVTRFALLMVVQASPGEGAPTSDEILRGAVSSGNGRPVAGGGTTSFSAPEPVGDGSCVTESVSTATVTKVIGTICARVVGVEAIVVMSFPADASATVGMVDAVAAAQ